MPLEFIIFFVGMVIIFFLQLYEEKITDFFITIELLLDYLDDNETKER